MNLDDIMLKEMSQMQKGKNTVRFHSCEGPTSVRAMGTESGMLVARGWGQGLESECLMSRGSVWGDDNFWREIRQQLHSIIIVLNATGLYTYKWLKW